MNVAEVVAALAKLSDESSPVTPEENGVFEALPRKLASERLKAAWRAGRPCRRLPGANPYRPHWSESA